MAINPKKILIVTHHYPPHITGVGNVAHNQAKRLVAMGHTVTVVTSDTGAGEQSKFMDGVNIIRVKAINILERWDIPFPIFSPRLLSVLSREVKRADIVHIHDTFYPSSFFAGLFANWYKKPIILTAHIALIAHPSSFVVLVEKIAYATTGRMLFKLSKLIVVYNDTVEQFLLKRGISREKIVNLFNGVDMDLFHPISIGQRMELRKKYGLDLEKKIVLFVGRYVYKKGYTKVMAAESDQYQLVFAGGDTRVSITPTMAFLGKLPPQQIAEVYQLADVFVLPSESEGFPLSIQEAMATSLPIITTSDKGYDRYGLDAKKIYFIQNPTNDSVQKAIKEVVTDDALLQEMGSYSHQYAVEHFSWDKSVAVLNDLYSDVLNKKKKLRIAFVSDAVYPYNKGGKEKRLYDITTRLAARGHAVTIYCMKWWKGSNIIENDGVTLHAISPGYSLYDNNRRSVREALLFSLHCSKILWKRFDVIDVDHIPHLVLYVMKIVCVLRGKRMIATWHEVWGKKYWKEYLGPLLGSIAYRVERISASLPNMIISVSERTTNELRRVLKTRKKIVTISNSIDIEAIDHSITGTPSDILFAGRLLPHKQVDTLLKAIAILRTQNPALRTVIIGDGVQRDYLEQLAHDLSIADSVTFTGFFEGQDEVYGMMKASKVFVLPSIREGFGIAVIEANAAGLPVVTVDAEHNASKDLITQGENGMVCRLDEHELAAAIGKLLAEKKKASFYKKYAEQYDWERSINLIEQSYV